MTQTQNEKILLGKWHLGKMIKSKYLINIGLPHTLNLFLTKSHIYTLSAKHSKIKLSRPVHIIEVPKRKKENQTQYSKR